MGVHFSRPSRLPMLVMEYLPLSLTQCLETHHNLPLQIKYSILLDVAKGLNYLHCKRPLIVHRDLTANNILLTSNFIAKISDLGVSRMADTFKLQQLTTAPGNWIVMPPESLKDNPSYDHKLDVFSYGCLILHVFTHQWPEPTDQYVRSTSWFRWNSFDLVSEWDRRSKYTKQLQNDPLYPFTKQCLDNNPNNRPAMNDAIQCVTGTLFKLPLLKNPLEMMKEISDLKILVRSERSAKANEIAHLHDIVRKSKQAVKQTNEDLRKMTIEKNKLLSYLSAKERSFAKQNELIQAQAQTSRKYWQHISELKKDLRKKEQENGSLQRQLNEIKILLSTVNNTVTLLTDEKIRLQSLQGDVSLLNERLENTLKSKDEVIKTLESGFPASLRKTLYKDQKEKIRAHMKQQLKKGDKW